MTAPDPAMTDLSESGLCRLMQWLSPAFPIGGYSYSHGLEATIADGLVRTGDDLASWLTTVLTRGTALVDAVLLREAWLSARQSDEARLDEVAGWGCAWRGSAEFALESGAQGTAFLAALAGLAPDPRLAAWRERLAAAGEAPAHAIAVGAAAGWAGLPLRATLLAYLQAMAANLISAGVRLVPLGQTEGQRILANLEPVLVAALQTALLRPWADLGAAAPMLDWASMRHETLYTRIFRS
jgi:urease accessory protein